MKNLFWVTYLMSLACVRAQESLAASPVNCEAIDEAFLEK